ncbi:hypothetical protein [Lacinutrix sp. 5H-3-7-4]|uniref:hypothetical protein n=1 Tax=Lacinutrix sp. (strain 5H-3-7-4) TaxID=983544 RepID=UPI00020A384C|nr:hypothetical protein [Lacinutrix sp. 5H-3-7-4]AEG99988.1 hypothetical protein Lacal_0136 [Lacinutrix sp. 5H-3-7-4]
MLKNILATVVGFVVASVVVYLFETVIGHNLFPLAEGAKPEDIEWIKANMQAIPVGSKIFVVIAHFMGIISGMAIAGFISKTSMIPAYIVGALMLLATFATIFMLPKELWFTAADAIFVIAGFFFGKSFAQRFVFN